MPGFQNFGGMLRSCQQSRAWLRLSEGVLFARGVLANARVGGWVVVVAVCSLPREMKCRAADVTLRVEVKVSQPRHDFHVVAGGRL